MQVYDAHHIRNVALLGHAGSGKTTLAECMLFESGGINRRGTIEEQNTVSDYHDIERERGASVFGTVLFAEWRNYKINIIDCPGYDDFVGEVVSALRVVDTGILTINSVNGVEVGSEIIWKYAKQFDTPIILAINKVDMEQSKFDRAVEQAKERFGREVTVVQYPYNEGTGFNSIIDVLKMTMYSFPAGGGKPEKLPIPAEEKEKAAVLHNELIEIIAESDESLMNLYFEKGELDEDEMRKGLQGAMISRQIFPVFCISAKQNMGSGRLMGFIDNVVPAPVEMPPKITANGTSVPCDPNGKTCAFVFKAVSEAHLGEMSFFRVYSGKIAPGQDLHNEQTGANERMSQVFAVNGKKRSEVNPLVAGDIGATVKLKNTRVNNTLHDKGYDLTLPPIQFPEPKVRVAISPAKKGEEDKLGIALHHLHEEDPTIIIEHSQELKQMIIHAQGDIHLSSIKWRLSNRFKIDAEFHDPKVPYRETIQKSIKGMYRHKKQSGGAGQFAEVHMLVEPYYEGMPAPAGITVRGTEEHSLPWGGKLVFLNCIVGGVIDQRFMPAILKGIMEKMSEGPLTGSPARDIRVSVFDGKMHPVDSNEAAFKTAGMMAFKDCFVQADPKILEPMYDVEIIVPEDFVGDVMSDLPSRRGIIIGIESEGHYQFIKARMPLAELDKYSSALRAMTQGRATYSKQFAEYMPTPPLVQQKLAADYQAHRHDEE
ncbi:elongation factor G [Ignavibacteria bacterium]|nr:elongation factor G [Bacteroidota bacterium]MCZ2131813.1 elongation factor G [Bacteroidota bacterium]